MRYILLIIIGFMLVGFGMFAGQYKHRTDYTTGYLIRLYKAKEWEASVLEEENEMLMQRISFLITNNTWSVRQQLKTHSERIAD